MSTSPSAPCPCGSGTKYKRCCRPAHQGRHAAATPEALMRSRFCAYALGLDEYILATTHPEGPMWEPDRATWLARIRQFSESTKFSDLQVIGARTTGDHATVLFRCVLDQGGEARIFSEESVFIRHDGRWKYHSGKVG